jgi:hypothetical protein
MCLDAIDGEPLNYWLWHELCRYYASKNDMNGAIQACKLHSEKSSTNPSPLMALSNLYAAKSEFKAAVESNDKLAKVPPTLIHLALSAVARTPYERNLKSSLERFVDFNHG